MGIIYTASVVDDYYHNRLQLVVEGTNNLALINISNKSVKLDLNGLENLQEIVDQAINIMRNK